MALTIYHNPRCSKSRQTLALIEAEHIKPQIVKYLETPLTEADIRMLLSRLGFESARHMMRTGEAVYKEMGLKQMSDENVLIRAMATTPKLIERPIVDDGERAIIGRPPEAVKALF